ncbi:MAG: hypothetical protein J6A96_03635 [Clostridia bacterium]|nr:hypothetical protein [Clostridia bacterium]
MELWQEIINKETTNNKLKITATNINEILESKCYTALNQIKEIIEDSTLTDSECFYKIEEIVCVFEELGSNGGARHDF